MKYIAFILCLIIPVIAANARAIREEANLAEEKSRTSYAFGMMVGSDLKQTGLEMDLDSFFEGLRASMEHGETRLNMDEALEIVQNAFEIAMMRQAVELQNKEMEFLQFNAGRPDIIVTESGLQYLILDEGDGPKPSPGDIVRVHYEGALTDGTIFDSSYHQAFPEEILLDMVIPGWAEGILLMNVGSRFRIYIPSFMAYGERGAGQIIPPFSTLVFTIELLGIVNTEEDY